MRSLSSKSDSLTYYTDDFILLSEFSEIEGPKPLLTIPTDGGTGFNKNEYSLHLMCVDFHSHLQPQPCSKSIDDEDSSSPTLASPRNKFSLTKDTSIINYWDNSVSVAACVHHFTLYDLEARGFVRPFCLAYVSYDQTKPVTYFEQIRVKFAEITDLFKKSNFNIFKDDLKQRCNDLRFTKEVFLKWSTTDLSDIDLKEHRSNLSKHYKLDAKTCAKLTASSINDTAKNAQLTAIDNLINELENVSKVIVNELKSKKWIIKRQKSFLVKHYNTRQCSTEVDSSFYKINEPRNRSLTYPPNLKLQKLLMKKNKKRSSPIIFQNILIGNLNNLYHNNGDVLASSGIDFHHLNQSKKLQQHKTMKRLQQLSEDTAKQAINELRLMHKYFSTPAYLIKYRDLSSRPLAKSSQKNMNLFWSVSLGECDIADFSTNIDTFNLNKYELIKKTNSFKNNESNIEIVSASEKVNTCAINSDEKPIFQSDSMTSVYTDAVQCGSRRGNFSSVNIERLLDDDDADDDDQNEAASEGDYDSNYIEGLIFFSF